MNRSSRPSRRTYIFALAAVTAVLVPVTITFSEGRAGDVGNAQEASSIEAVAEKLAAGQATERAELNAHLSSAADVAQGHLARVLQDLALAVPVDPTISSTPASAGDVDKWNRNLASAASALEAVKDGTSEQTVTREALLGAAELLQSAAAGYEHSLTAPADQRDALAVTVGKRREAAVRLWQAGAGQLDTLTVKSGGAHVHVFLALNGDPEAVPEEFQEPETQH
ncbi:hypothetical protein QFZ70_003614 [Arthrobacter sp. V1I9]|uniref:hypothetical protein n=1 Tax=Arthrobacter sp. V1I9 TaxID=3042275 RepID=UPI00279252AD|nr:hypothetical protein [Arthrobacter sp. V1I9]MDQ0871141.1 hypothetical protein [Arthrobacter sp. V1I9]